MALTPRNYPGDNGLERFSTPIVSSRESGRADDHTTSKVAHRTGRARRGGETRSAGENLLELAVDDQTPIPTIRPRYSSEFARSLARG